MNSITNKQKRPGPIVLDVAGLVLGLTMSAGSCIR